MINHFHLIIIIFKLIMDDTVFFNDEILINNMEFCYSHTLVDVYC